MEDFYPMPMFVNLEVADPAASADWYRRALGFRVVFQAPPDAPTMVHLRRERYQDLLLAPAPDGVPGPPGGGVTIQFQAGATPVAEIARQARAAGTARVEGPQTQPWNVRDVTLVDPDGYCLRFSEPVDVNKSFDEVMRGAGFGEEGD